MPVATHCDYCDRVLVHAQLEERPLHRGDVEGIVERLCERLDALWPPELPPLLYASKFFTDHVGGERVEFVIVAAATEHSSVLIRTDTLLAHAPEEFGTERAALDLLARVRRKLHA
jgi:hypothetical protein